MIKLGRVKFKVKLIQTSTSSRALKPSDLYPGALNSRRSLGSSSDKCHQSELDDLDLKNVEIASISQRSHAASKRQGSRMEGGAGASA